MITKEAIEAAKKAAPQFWRDTDNFERNVSKILAAALAAMPGPVVRVKALEWGERVHGTWHAFAAVAYSAFQDVGNGKYFVRVAFPAEDFLGPFDTLEAAKAAAQADYEARIMAAIDPAPDLASENESLPQDVINLVIAAREFWDVAMDESDESAALDSALEAFSSRVPYENEPEEDRAALERT